MVKGLLLATLLFLSPFVNAQQSLPPFKIFQIGFNKCATTTLNDFFNANGIPSVHWDGAKLAHSIHRNYILRRPLLDQEYIDTYVAFFDMNSVRSSEPIEIGVMLFKELDRQYPGSKFILNIRDKDAWLLSRSNHNTVFNMTLLQRSAELYGVTTPEMLDIWSETWDSHHKAVLEYFKNRPQDLLVFDLDNDPPSKISEFFAPYFTLDPTLFGHKNNTTSKRGSGFSFFDKIYTINLRESTDRREHMQQEFARLGLDNIEYIDAVGKDSVLVKKAMSSYFVKKYPPCFRCNKILNCTCDNNVLIAPQIGNWLSFIKIFERMIADNVHYALITEDDIKFTADAHQIFGKLINYKNLADNRIDLNQPFIIRFHGKFDPTNRGEIYLDKNPQLSNPCFMVNKKFAQLFLKRLGRIETTSDIYIHLQLPQKDRSIQHFAAHPKPVYQLSTGEGDSGVPATFYSTIHPKGIDDADRGRKAAHVKRVEYWQYLRNKLSLR